MKQSGSGVLVDTDILIDFLRGHPSAGAILNARFNEIAFSAISVAELYAGAREGEEKPALQRMISASRIIDVTPEIAAQAGMLKKKFGKSHGIGLADAIVAETP